MFRRLVLSLALFVGLLALADRGLAMVAGNAAADRIKTHEGLRDDPTVHFRGFPFATQAFRARFDRVDVSVRDVVREGLTIDRIDATLEDVKVDFNDALEGRVQTVPVGEGHATVRISYADLAAFLAEKPGDVRLVVREGRVRIVATLGISGVGEVEVEGTPVVKVAATSIDVTASGLRMTSDPNRLTPAVATTVAARVAFSIPLGELPFGIALQSATLGDTALIVTASAKGFVIDVRA